jgi:FkbM family methyltransferase
MDYVENSSGIRIYVDPRDSRGGALIASGGDFNPHSLELWNIGLARIDWHTVIDVGFNYGEMLVSADLPASSELFAFEPNPRVLPFSRRTLAEFGRPVTLIESAVSDHVGGSVPFSVDLEWSGTSGLAEVGLPPASGTGHTFTSVNVPVTTLDATFVPLNPPNIAIKIDVEGHELSVLAGAGGLLENTDDWLVMLEILHMTSVNIAKISRGRPIFVLHSPTGRLVRLTSRRPRSMARVMSHPDIYGQDAILVSAERILDGLTIKYSEVLRHSRQSRPARASLLRRAARRIRRVIKRILDGAPSHG